MIPRRDDGLTITVLESADTGSALVCLGGEIDQAGFQRLSDAADRLATVAPASVFVDLGAVTFAGATLPNFVARMHGIVPDSAALVMCRSTPMTRWVLEATGMTEIATIRPDLPAPAARRGADLEVY
jgi:anti-anti-sigma regulatory factor